MAIIAIVILIVIANALAIYAGFLRKVLEEKQRLIDEYTNSLWASQKDVQHHKMLHESVIKEIRRNIDSVYEEYDDNPIISEVVMDRFEDIIVDYYERK